ncbi:hypothetical protein LCGC14_2941580, partial [marine sediment metagenome]
GRAVGGRDPQPESPLAKDRQRVRQGPLALVHVGAALPGVRRRQAAGGVGASTLVVDGATLTHPAAGTAACIHLGAQNTATIRNCTVNDNCDGIRGSTLSLDNHADGNVLIHDCVVTYTSVDSVSIWPGGGGRTLDVWDCSFTWTADCNISVRAACFLDNRGGAVTIRRCTLDARAWTTTASTKRVIYQGSGTSTFEGNLFLCPVSTVFSLYIIDIAGGTASIFHNTLVTTATSTRAIYLRVDGSVVRGNIIDGGFNVGIRAVAESNYTGTYNCVFGTTDAFEMAVAGVGDIETDPILDASYVPSAAAVLAQDAIDSYQQDAHVLTLGPNIARAPTADRTTASKTTALSDMGCFNRTIVITAAGPATFTGWSGSATGT